LVYWVNLLSIKVITHRIVLLYLPKDSDIIMKMKVIYFPDTDTALIEFSNKKIYETREINENILVDFDYEGNVVSMTIEHAKKNAQFPHLSYTEVTEQVFKQSA